MASRNKVRKGRLRWARPAALLAAMAGGLCCGGPTAAAGRLNLQVLSGRPDMVSGGDALVGVDAPPGGAVQVRLNGRDVSQAFRPSGTDGRLIGRVDGLKRGKNSLRASAGGASATLQLVNHPLSGPIISGPHQTPFACQTEDNGLGPALDAECNARPLITYHYKSTEPPTRAGPPPAMGAAPGALAPGFKRFDPSAPRPADLAATTTSDGRTVDFIVRREIGVINRAVYEIQFLHQPGQAPPDPWSRAPGWNGRLVYGFGGGCFSGFRQGKLINASGVPTEALLASGYAVASSTLNIFGVSCNDRTSAETAMMVKEYFTERFGPPVHTIGLGASGGSMQLHLIAQNYPGLLDGVVPLLSYPDFVTVAADFNDCLLLDHAFTQLKDSWTEDQKTAVSGFATWKRCGEVPNVGAMFGIPFSSRFNSSWVGSPACHVLVRNPFHPVTNPKGVRCSVFDNQVNIYGKDARTGRTRRPLDNVGVQYGLAAFNTGRISADQFIALNAQVGGFDGDGMMAPARTKADPEALRIAYREGLVNTGGGGAGAAPIIDLRPYLDPSGDAHDRSRSFMTRARLAAANGDAGNQVILTYDPATPGAAVLRTTEAVALMDRWLDALARDGSPGRAAAVRRARPAELTDACWTAAGEKIVETASFDGPGRCNQLYPSHANPRMAAGAPVAGDILKCQLKPVRAEDYARPLTPEQIARLKAVFPQGVCDYGKPGVGQGPTRLVWRGY